MTPEQLYQNYSKAIDRDKKVLDLLFTNQKLISDFEGQNLKDLYKIMTTNKSIIGKKSKFIYNIKITEEPSEKKMRDDIRDIIEQRRQAHNNGPAFSASDIRAAKAAQCLSYKERYDNLTNDNRDYDAVELSSKKLEEKIAPDLINFYADKIIDQIKQGKSTETSFEKLAKHIGEDLTTQFKKDLTENKTRIESLSDQDLEFEKRNKSDELAEKFKFKKAAEQVKIEQAKKEFSESFIKYTDDIMQVIRPKDPNPNLTLEEKTEQIKSLTSTFLNKYTTLAPEEIQVGAKELAKEILKAAGKEKHPWTYEIRQTFRSMIGTSHAQQIDAVFDKMVPKDKPNVLIKDAKGIILAPKPIPVNITRAQRRGENLVGER